MSIIIAVLIFCIIIIVHEIGHFSAARLFKMRVYSFNLGMGPTLLKKRRNNTDYCLKAIPFGGSVQLGEDDEEENDPNAFRRKPVWQRMIVMLAGAFMNIVLGFLLCIIIVSTESKIVTTTIDIFREEPLSNQHLREGDKITHVNGMRIFTFFDLDYQLINTEMKMSEGSDRAYFNFTVRRNGEKIKLENVAFRARDKENGGKSIYRDFYVLPGEKNVFSVTSEAARQAATYSRLVIITLIDLIRGTYGINDISGPVGVVTIIGEVSQSGFERSIIDGIRNALIMAALITVNVGIFNLLPVPALDGARFLFFAVEAVRRKPLKAELEGMIHFIGFAALMLFMVLITVLDVRKLFG